MVRYESKDFKSCEAQEMPCDQGHQVCPTKTCSRKKQVKKLFLGELPCAPSCAGCEGAKRREDLTWSSILTCLHHLGKKVAVEEGKNQQEVTFRRAMNLTRMRPYLWSYGPFSSERGMWFPCLSPAPSPTPTCPFLPPSCLQRESGG